MVLTLLVALSLARSLLVGMMVVCASHVPFLIYLSWIRYYSSIIECTVSAVAGLGTVIG